MRVLLKGLGGRSTVLAMALASVMAVVGCGGSNNSLSSGGNVTATPTFSPGAGKYNKSQTVTIADTTSGAVLYCTTDGSTPTTSSQQCAQPTTVFQTQFLQAIAVAPGKQPSAVASAAYTITFPSAPPPTFNPAGGTYTGAQQVTIGDSLSGANIYYTLDGSTPTANSTLYSGPVSIATTSTLSAIAIATNYADSTINSATYTIQAALPAPVVSSLSPASANAGGAAFMLTVNGSNFVSGASVLWNGAALTTTFGSATSLTAMVPASDISTAGTANVAVSQPSGISGVVPFTVNSVVPIITSLSPSSGAAGTSVTITGTNFTGATAVSFGATAAASFTATSATSITAIAPAGSGTVNVTVVTPNGTSAIGASDQFTYSGPAVTGVSPSSGLPAGGTSVTITGTGFTGATAVSFGATPAASFTVASATSITAISPAGTGTVDVKVTTPNGTSAASASDQFTYSGPAVTGVSPSGGLPAGGTSVTITGTAFTGATAVNFGTTAASSFTVTSATSITAVSPAGTGTVDVTVVTPNGTTPISAADQFVYGAAVPSVTSLTPSVGPIGSTVVIAGSNFGSTQGSSTVTFNGTAATTINSWSNTSVSAVVPAGATTGALVVTVNGVASNSDQTFTVGTTLSGIVVSGPVSGGTPIAGASVQLWAAGATGYGTGATAVGSPVTSDSQAGTFSIPYDCSTLAPPGDQLYLVATSAQNSDAVLMTAIGACGKIQAGVTYTINEATTVASVYALQQFMSANGTIGAAGNSLSYTGLSNAFLTVNNLVDSTGIVRDHTPAYPNNFTNDQNIVNNSTVPQARINTLANALNACMSSSGGCSGLFTAATTSAGAPANTLQAIFNIAQNPGNNAAAVYSAATGTAFTPTLLGAPNDWTLALTFTGGGLGLAPTISGTDTLGDSGVGPNIATSLAIDANGNVFVAGFGEYGGYPSSFLLDTSILAEFNNQGAPQTQPATVSSGATIGFGGYLFGLFTLTGAQTGLSSVGIDTAGNIWATDLSNGGYVFTVNPTVVTQNQPPLASTSVGNSLESLTIDPISRNNAWVGGVGFGEYTYAPVNTTLQAVSLAQASSAYSWTRLSDLTFDSAYNLWGYDSNASTIFEITADGSFVYSAYPTRGSGSRQAMSLAPDNAGHVYACGDANGTTLDVLTASLAASGNPPTAVGTLGPRGCGEQLLLDGQSHLFAISNGFGRAGITGATIDEYTTAGVPISPNNGYTGTSSAEQPTITIDSNAPLSNYGLAPTTGAIDGSGNLWLVNADTSNSGGTGCATSCSTSTGNVLVEFVGLAAPVVTPTATALVNGQYGTRP